ncbi:MAG TPA: serine/threonine-protein kinase [Glycomyces sp.]|nr:serine/threonine-protein kinase [Glycomyces sp.]
MLPLGPNDPCLVGRYRVLALLGEGGMGRVYLAVGPDGRRVAVKRILPHLAGDPGFRQRFALEVAAARKVAGAHTVRVVDADAASGEPWSATAFVPGPTLVEAVEASGPLPEAYVRSIGMDLASALGDVHSAGLIHRDVKPSNVLLSAAGAQLLDFGVSRAVDYSTSTALTRTGGVIGSPGYMSPEQAEAKELTEQSDVFSLGCLLATAASGRAPFEGPSIPQVLYRIVHTPPDLEGVPASLREVIERCLAKDPAERPSPPELRRLLEEGGEADPAPPEAVRAHAGGQEAAIGGLLAVSPQPTLVDNGPTLAFQHPVPAPPRAARTGLRNVAIAAIVAVAALAVIVPIWIMAASGGDDTGSGEDPVIADGGDGPSDDTGEEAADADEAEEASTAIPAEVCGAVDVQGMLDLVGPGSSLVHYEEGEDNDSEFASCSIMVADDRGMPTSLLATVGRNNDATGGSLSVCHLEGCDGVAPAPLPYGESTERPWTKGAVIEPSGHLEMAWYKDDVVAWVTPLTSIDDGSDAEAEYLAAQGVALYDLVFEG